VRPVHLAIAAAVALACPMAARAQAPPAVAPASAPQDTAPAHRHHEPAADSEQPPARPSSAHDGHQDPGPYPAFIRPVTEADRAAAFADLQGHTVHDDTVNVFVLADQLEWQPSAGSDKVIWDSKGWVGGDRDRLWFRSEGESDGDHLADAQVQVLYGRAISPWWDLVAGVRQDIEPGPAQTWAAVGLQGLAPFWFDVEATAYIGASGRTHFRFETEYELLLTNRLILQPLVELDVYGKDDPERRVGAGLSSTEAGLRLRFELRRELAPYIGVAWKQKHLGTADYAREDRDATGGVRMAFGLRCWF
jgi:copper resistance protein B